MSPSNVSSVVDYFATPNEGFATTLGSTISSGAVTVPLSGTSGLVNGTVFVGIIEPGATNEQVFTGIVNVGSSEITSVVWTRGTNNSHVGGVAIVDYVTGTAFKMMTTGILVQHTQTGTHTGITTDTLTASGTGSFTGALTTTGGLATTNTVAAKNLATTAISIGYAQTATTPFTTTTTSADVDVTGLSVTVTVPSGGRYVRIIAYCPTLEKTGSAGDVLQWKIKEGSTVLQNTITNIAGSNFGFTGLAMYENASVTTGSHTYKVSVQQATAGTITVAASATAISSIKAEVL